MRSKRIMALVLATVMVAGNGMTAFAANTGEATGEGTLIPHLDKDCIDVTLPTSAEVANVFDFTVDPEALIKDAEKLTDGTMVTGNEEGVYFKNAGTAAKTGTAAYTSSTNTGNGPYTVAGVDLTVNADYTYSDDEGSWLNTDGSAVTDTITITDKDSSSVTLADGDQISVTGAVAAGAASYSNKSDTVEFKGENSVNVDVTVVAEVEASSTGAKDIALVADQAALDAATVPALLMTLKVGTDEKVITTAASATAKAMIAGAPDNFKVDVNSSNNGFEYVKKADADASKWGSATVQLIGKTNKVDAPTGADALTAPKVKLTWTVTKSTTPAGPTLSNATANTADTGVDFNTTFTKGTALTCAFTGLGDGVTVKSATWGKTMDAITSTSANITASGTSFTIAASMWGTAQNNELRYIKITTSDNNEIVIKVTVKA